MCRLLIVDDNEEYGNLLSVVTEKTGHFADEVHTGEQALKMIANIKYDGVILDVLLPDMLGWKIARYIRRIMRLNIPIFVISSIEQKRLDNYKDYNEVNRAYNKQVKPKRVIDEILKECGVSCAS